MDVKICDVCRFKPAERVTQDTEFKDQCVGCEAALRTARETVIKTRRVKDSPFEFLFVPQQQQFGPPPVVPHEWKP